MDEAASKGQFAVIVVFVLVGARRLVCCWGAVTAWTLRDLGWIVTPLVITATTSQPP